MNQTDCLIGFGANTGDCRQSFFHAIELMGLAGFDKCRPSMMMRSRPVGGQAGEQEFLNGVVAAQWPAEPLEAFAVLKRIERSLGRTGGPRWGPRAIDLDLLMHGSRVQSAESLILPHPRMCCRKFVLRPATEVACSWIHPVSHLSLGDLWGLLCDSPRQVLWVTKRRESELDEITGRIQAAIQFDCVSDIHDLSDCEHTSADAEHQPDFPVSWRCLVTDRISEPVNCQKEFRLVVWDHREWKDEPAILQQLQSHRGIKLDLAFAAIDEATEIQAALEGMS